MSYRVSTVVERDPQRVVVRGAGELDAFAAPALRAALLAVAEEPAVVCDLASADFLDSTALGVIVGGFRRAREAHRAFSVVLPRGRARRIFELTSLDRVLPIE